ncbi:metallophosphoesterase [Streptomyces sp. NBC_00009]|uniref:metallophosphoesterase n=1 Tax=Streptomyces sp. NBC_00009 TaxID=2975620 RepID=UPI00324A343E
MEYLVLAGLLALLVGVHWYLWRRLVADTTSTRRVRRAGAAVLLLLGVLMVATTALEAAHLLFPVQQIIAWPGYLWSALLLYLTLLLIVRDAAAKLIAVLRRLTARDSVDTPAPQSTVPTQGRRSGSLLVQRTATDTTSVRAPAAPAASRRVFLARTTALVATVAATTTVGAGTYEVFRGPRLKHLTVPIAKLPRQAHGYRIAVVSDIHLGPILGHDFAQQVVKTVNSAQADLIAIVGDLVDGRVDDLRGAVAPLAQLTARDGVFFVTGNHEYESGAPPWIEHVRALGLQPLENARRELPYFDLAGVNDVSGQDYGQGPDYDRALGDRDRSRPSVLLAHQPVMVDEAMRFGVDLQLSGHTHGGQLWPGNYLAGLAGPAAAGLKQVGDTQLYVTRGAGAWGPPVRVGAPSDITVVTLAGRHP